ncbi:MAG: InlB B-repeat-containing protein [Lachnospiraceae bacterium]|nr:InlB B-repeat-containing protein [Lachnospiraceae bacterium]
MKKTGKKSLFQRVAAAFLAVVFLFNTEGIRGFGALKAQAASGAVTIEESYYPDELDPDGSISIVNDNTIVAFCFYMDSADIYLENFDSGSLYAPTGTTYTIYPAGDNAPAATEEAISSPYEIVGWEKMGEKGNSDQHIVVYAAKFSMFLKYCPDGYNTDIGATVSASSTITSGTTNVTFNLLTEEVFISELSNTFEDYTIGRRELTGWESDTDEHEPGAEITIPFEPETMVYFDAIWDSYIDVTYDPNGGVGSTITEKSYITEGVDIMRTTLLSSEECFFYREGYYLAGWEISADDSSKVNGSGLYELGGSCLHVTGAETLSFNAVWEEIPSVTVTYSAGEGTGENLQKVYTFEPEEVTESKNIELLSEASSFTREGYELAGWKLTEKSKSTDGTTVSYELGGTCSLVKDCDAATFEAVWEEIEKPSVTVTYRPNGGTGEAESKKIIFEPDTGADMRSIELLSEASFTREGYELAGWKLTDAESSADEKTDYDLGESCNFWANREELIFDAVWKEIKKPTVTVTYRPGEGKGTEITKKLEFDADTAGKSHSITLLSEASFTRDGYELSGWKLTDKNNSSNGTTDYELGGSCSVKADIEEVTFDAVWKEKEKKEEKEEEKKEDLLKGKVNLKMDSRFYLGTEIEYEIKKNSKGAVTVEYKKKDAKDDTYTSKEPTEVGTYIARAKLKKTSTYSSDTDTKEFEVVYLDVPEEPYTYTEVKNSKGTVKDLKIVPASGYHIGVSPSGRFETSVLHSAAKTGGYVHLRRDKDGAITGPAALIPYTAKDDPQISLPVKIYAGAGFEVEASALSEAVLIVMYKEYGAPDETYTTEVPTAYGKYTVRITSSADGFYAPVNFEKDFSIDYLEAPAKGAAPTGIKGNGDWYTSDVVLTAPDGYLVSTSRDGKFTESVTWNENIKELFYKRKSDNAVTDAVKVSFKLKIDKDIPEVSFDPAYGVQAPRNGETLRVYADELRFTFSDLNLKTVIADGKEYAASDGLFEVLFAAGEDVESKTVTAFDEAGNSYSFTVEIWPAWRKDNTVPEGKEILLTQGIEYNLKGESSWKIKGDKTVYSGGGKFYIRTSGKYTFGKAEK